MAKKVENDLKKEVLKEAKEKVLNELNKEIKASITSQVEKYKEEFREEISKDILEEVENVMKREEKRIIRNRTLSLFKKNVAIFILLIIVCYFGYCLYDVKYFDFMKSECERNGNCAVISNEDSNNIEQEENVIKDKDWYIENYGYLLNEANVLLSADQANAYYLYSGDHKVNEIKTSYLLNLAYKKMDNKNVKTNSVSVTINAEDLRNAFQDLFGTLDNYKDTNFTYGCLNFVYNSEKDRYVAENNKCTISNKEILENISDMYEEENKLYILTTATIYDKAESSYYTFDNLFDPILANVTDAEFLENAKKLNKYQYIYKKVDDSYYLNSITKLK